MSRTGGQALFDDRHQTALAQARRRLRALASTTSSLRRVSSGPSTTAPVKAPTRSQTRCYDRSRPKADERRTRWRTCHDLAFKMKRTDVPCDCISWIDEHDLPARVMQLSQQITIAPHISAPPTAADPTYSPMRPPPVRTT